MELRVISDLWSQNVFIAPDPDRAREIIKRLRKLSDDAGAVADDIEETL